MPSFCANSRGVGHCYASGLIRLFSIESGFFFLTQMWVAASHAGNPCHDDLETNAD